MEVHADFFRSKDPLVALSDCFIMREIQKSSRYYCMGLEMVCHIDFLI